MRLKGVILAAGKGTRMRGVAGNKCLSVAGGKSLIAHNIERLLSAGVRDIIVVVGLDSEIIKRHTEPYTDRASIAFAVQKTQAGIPDAVRCAASFLADGNFALCLGDELLYNDRAGEMISWFRRTGADCVCGVVPGETVDEIKKCYSVLADASDRILDLAEKPGRPFNDLKGTGFCVFSNRTLGVLDTLSPNPVSGQYELCDWIKACMAAGMDCRIFRVADREFNINTAQDLCRADGFFSSLLEKEK